MYNVNRKNNIGGRKMTIYRYYFNATKCELDKWQFNNVRDNGHGGYVDETFMVYICGKKELEQLKGNGMCSVHGDKDKEFLDMMISVKEEKVQKAMEELEKQKKHLEELKKIKEGR